MEKQVFGFNTVEDYKIPTMKEIEQISVNYAKELYAARDSIGWYIESQWSLNTYIELGQQNILEKMVSFIYDYIENNYEKDFIVKYKIYTISTQRTIKSVWVWQGPKMVATKDLGTRISFAFRIVSFDKFQFKDKNITNQTCRECWLLYPKVNFCSIECKNKFI